MKYLFSTVLTVWFLSACSSSGINKDKVVTVLPPEAVIPESFGTPPDFNEQALFQLTTEQVAQFRDWFDDPRRAEIAPHQRLYDYLENYTWGFDYKGETYTASEAMQRKAGNCLSLAMMTTALARIAGIETGYQLVNATPVFKKQNNVLLLSYHVRTYLYDPTWQPEKDVITLVRPRLVVDYFPNRYDVPGAAVDEQQFISMYYRNLAADALLENNLTQAYWLANKALEKASGDAENINLMAILYRHIGDPVTSERFYQHGMTLVENNTNMLGNYAVLLDSLDRHSEAEQVRQKLLEYPDSNPYAWIKLGHEAYNDGEHTRAINYYQRAMALAPYLDEIYFGMAKSLYKQGKYSKAAQAMRTAAKTSWEQAERDLYYAKLSALRARNFDGN